MLAEELIRAGRPAAAIAELQQEVRRRPADARLRVFLFQVLAVAGQWQRALTQLNVAADLDESNLLMAQVCRDALQCEALRAEVFAGRRSPVIFGEPSPWISWLLRAIQLLAANEIEEAVALRDRAFEAAPAVGGTINGEAFEWIADADGRLGPVLEAIIAGRYLWVPFPAIRMIRLEPPTDLRDLVWIPATMVWTNGGEAAALIPSRYANSTESDDESVVMASKTIWTNVAPNLQVGLGQRTFATDAGDFPLLEVREIIWFSEDAERASRGDEGLEPRDE